MNKRRSKTHYIPIADCPKCGLKDTPLSQQHHKMKHKDTGKEIEFWLITCPQCDTIFNWDKKTMKLIKGYISLKDIEDMGYKTEDGKGKINDG